jgi:hypothetical protein
MSLQRRIVLILKWPKIASIISLAGEFGKKINKKIYSRNPEHAVVTGKLSH